MKTTNHEQKTMRAYVIGFVLSLVYTAIPYYLVVNQVITGQALLLTILGFGLLQMLVQLIFFLHLGRGPNASWNIYFLISTVGIILVVVGGSLVIMNNLHGNLSPYEQVKKLTNDEGIYQIGNEKTGACQGQYENHKVSISNTDATPVQIIAGQCDTLTFMNQGDEARTIVFGERDQRDSYAGETEYEIRSGQNKTITLSELGTYKFHDELQPEVGGYFTVNSSR